MEILIEILKIILPAAIVAATAIVIIRMYLVREAQRNDESRRSDAFKTTLNLRLQAHERLILFLERIQPFQLLTRLSARQQSATDLHSEALTSIRDEFEHNISQQLYISADSWNEIKKARELALQLFNGAVAQLAAEATSRDLAEKVLENEKEASQQIALAISNLKKDVQDLF